MAKKEVASLASPDLGVALRQISNSDKTASQDLHAARRERAGRDNIVAERRGSKF